jgi:hypothetical protein
MQTIGIMGKLPWVGGSMGPWVSRGSDVGLAHVQIARRRFLRQGSLQVAMKQKGPRALRVPDKPFKGFWGL